MDPPVGSVSINGGAAFTNDGYVVVSMHATDASAMSVWMSCDGLNWQFSGVIDGAIGWGLGDPSCASQPALKTIFVRWVDHYGNSTVASDSIIFDQSPPSGSVLIAGGSASVDSPSVAIDVTAADALSGVSDVAG